LEIDPIERRIKRDKEVFLSLQLEWLLVTIEEKDQSSPAREWTN
jgi:hypothetical protein